MFKAHTPSDTLTTDTPLMDDSVVHQPLRFIQNKLFILHTLDKSSSNILKGNYLIC